MAETGEVVLKTNVIHNEDCLTGMRKLPDNSIDLIVTDPPYNEDYKYRGSDFIDRIPNYYEFIDSVLQELRRVLKDSGSLYFKHSSRQVNKLLPILDKHFIFRNLIIWISNSQAHPNMNYDSFYEPIYFYTASDKYVFRKRAEMRQKPPDYWSGEGKEFIGLLVNCWYDIKKIQAGCLASEGGNEGNFKLHPCSMPVRLAERAINISSEKDDVVLDPFMGSGTTALACEILDRRYIGFEIEKKYCDIAEERIGVEKSQLKFRGEGY